MTDQNISILAHTDTGIYFGILSLSSEMRLYDFINLSPQYLHLIGRETSEVPQEAVPLNQIYINKKAIRILTTIVDDEGRGSPINKVVYRFVQKKPLKVKIYMPDYEITGNLHILNEESVSKIIENPLPFLPCTEVEINNIRINKVWHATFAAINKNNIAILEKVESYI